jgi:hypothetical protein
MRTRLLAVLPTFFAGAVPLPAQSARDTAAVIAQLDAEIAAFDTLLERVVWPGYHFKQLGLMYVIPGKAKVAAHWPGSSPSGMLPLLGHPGMFWTDTGVVRWQSGLPVASLSISPTQSRAAVAGLALHEAFHAFEVTQRKSGRRFGRGENAMLTAQYPVFDVENEAAVFVESQLLRNALQAKSTAAARQAAQQFLAVRELRHARMDSSFVNFEKLTEMHEGLAQYALLRGLAVLAERRPQLRAGAAAELAAEAAVLFNTLAPSNLSVRRRAYATGAHMGLLLDRLGDVGWKDRVMQHDEWLQDILAGAVGRLPVTDATNARLRSAIRDAAKAVATLRAQRAQQRDSVLARAPLKLAIDPVALAPRFEWCGFDPQNLRTTGNGELLHMRLVNLCSKGITVARIFQPAVEDESTGRVTTAVQPAAVEFTVNGQAAQLPAVGTSMTGERIALKTPDVEIELARGILIRAGQLLLIIPLEK